MTVHYTGKVNATDTDDFLDKIKNAAVAGGWTLHDDMSASSPSAYILKSAGESGTEMDCYFRIFVDTNKIKFQMYSYWNNTTHAGTFKTYSNNYGYIVTDEDASFDCIVSATKDFICMASFVAAKWYYVAVGLLEPFTNDCNGTLASSASSGSDVVLTLGSGETANFKVGGNYQIMGNDYRQWVEVGAVDHASDQITIVTLSYAFDAGSRIGNNPHNWWYHIGERNYGFKFKYNVNGSGDDTSQISTLNIALVLSSDTDPSPRSGHDDMFVLWPFGVSDNYAMGGIQHESYPVCRCDVNSTGNEHILTVGDDVNSTSTGSNTSTVFNDSGASWTVDEHIDKVIAIPAGTGAGQVRYISSNTAAGLTVSEAFDVTPDATSEYCICSEAWLYFYFMNSASFSAAIRIA